MVYSFNNLFSYFRNKIIICVLFCAVFEDKLQSQNFVKGSIVDSTKSPVAYCALALLHAKDSSIVKGNVADEKGEFIFEKITAGNYIIKYSAVGFQSTWSQPIQVDSLSQISLPPQVLKNEGVNLQEISVAAFKPTVEFKNGVVIMNIENNILAGGNTVFELLKRVPGVTVDAQNNISINGRSGVRFLFDGRLQQIPTSQMVNILMGMAAESVSSIEVIKNPPAKYDASGSGGLINIVIKKAKVNGFSGSFSQSTSMGMHLRSGTSLSLNYKSNKLTLYSNMSYYNLQFETDNYYLRRIADANGTFEVVSTGKQLPYRSILNLSGGLEYDITKKTSIGLNVNGSPSSVNNTENAQGDINSGTTYNYSYYKFNIGTRQNIDNPAININATHKFDSLTKLQFSADYTDYMEQFSRFTTNNFYNNANQEVAPANSYGSANKQ
jgi:iron complex outermembrane receptor protein